jgi:hypothetical protein
MINQKQPVDVEDFHYLGSFVRNICIHVKLSAGLPCPEQYSKSRTSCDQQFEYIFEEGTVICYIYNVILFGAKS